MSITNKNLDEHNPDAFVSCGVEVAGPYKTISEILEDWKHESYLNFCMFNNAEKIYAEQGRIDESLECILAALKMHTRRH